MGKLYLLTGDIIENSKDMDAIVANAENVEEVEWRCCVLKSGVLC